jgi:hypothetical protein
VTERSRNGIGRIGLVIAGAAVILLEGFWGDSVLSREHPGSGLGCVVVAIFSCIPVVGGMIFVRLVLKASAVRILFDVFAVLMWVVLVTQMGQIPIHGASAASDETLEWAPIFSIGATLIAVCFVSMIGLAMWAWSRFKRIQP